MAKTFEPKISRFSVAFHAESCSPSSSPPPSPLGSPLDWNIKIAYRVRVELEKKSSQILAHANAPDISMDMLKVEGIIEEMESTNAALGAGRISHDYAERFFLHSMEMLFDMSAEFDRHLHRIQSSAAAMPRQKRSLTRRHGEMRSHRGGGEDPGDPPSLRERFVRGMETMVCGICGRSRKSRVPTEGIAKGGMASNPQAPGNEY